MNWGKDSRVPLLARREALEKELDTVTGACRRYKIDITGDEVGSGIVILVVIGVRVRETSDGIGWFVERLRGMIVSMVC